MDKRPGFTLGEMILALGISALGLLTLVLLVSTIWRAASEGKYHSAASSHARRTLERLRGEPDYLRGVLDGSVPAAFNTTLSVDDALYVPLNTTIALEMLSGTDRYLDVEVTVLWEQEHRARRLSLETYLPAP